MKTDLEARFIDGARVRAMLSAPSTRERVLIGLAAISSASRAIIIKGVVEVPDEAFLDPFRAVWSHRFTMAQVQRARTAGMGICIVHSHGGTGAPMLSGLDKGSVAEQAGAIQALFPEMPVASVVTSGDWHAAGVVFTRSDARALTVGGARWMTSFIEVTPPPSATTGASERGIRHLPVWGGIGEARVRAARVGVIGLGGGGSHVVQQLAHLGVHEVVGVDDDVLEDHNRTRVVGTRDPDIGKKKLRAMKRLVQEASGKKTRFTTVDGRFPAPPTLDALGSCDVIVGCVDNHRVRRDLQDFASRHAIPIVDIGLTIEPSDLECRPIIGGQVFVGVPGGSCMWCARVLTKEALASELDERGYVRGGGEAQVVSLNGVLASQAVTEVLNLLTGFQTPEVGRLPAKLVFDGRSLRVIETPAKPGCPTCASVGSGDVIWGSKRSHDAEEHAQLR